MQIELDEASDQAKGASHLAMTSPGDHLEEFRVFIENRDFNIYGIERALGLTKDTIANCIRRLDPYRTGKARGLGEHEKTVIDHFKTIYGFQSERKIKQVTEEYDLENFRRFVEQRHLKVQSIENRLRIEKSTIYRCIKRIKKKSGEVYGLGKHFKLVINHFINQYYFDNKIRY